MTELENVVKGMECCLSASLGEPICPTCTYRFDKNGVETGDCEANLLKDAIALLKAQEPRVMTLEEIEDWDGAVFFEAYETDMYYALIETVELTAGMDGEFVFVNVVPGEHHRRVWGGENYGSIWRCWTSRPDEATMEATPWD